MSDALDSRSWRLGAGEVSRAVNVYDDAPVWLTESPPPDSPVAAEVWVYNSDHSKVLLVQHRWRGWVPPGGAVEPGEHPRDAAVREVLEETGLVVTAHPRPAAVAVRSFHPAWPETLALSYWAVIEEREAVGEEGQPVEWRSLTTGWDGYFPEDPERIRWHARWLAQAEWP